MSRFHSVTLCPSSQPGHIAWPSGQDWVVLAPCHHGPVSSWLRGVYCLVAGDSHVNWGLNKDCCKEQV